MNRTVISYDEQATADSLVRFVLDNPRPGSVIYIEDTDGRVASRVSLVQETLSDGGFVYNLVISFS